MTEQAARELFITIAKELALPEGWRLKFDSSKRRFGQCKYRARYVGGWIGFGRRGQRKMVGGRWEEIGPGVISLSSPLVALNDETKVGATIRHEIAHALVGPGHGHDNVWRIMALKCGDSGERCYSEADTETPDAPIKATCPLCKREHKKFRMPKRVRWCHCAPRPLQPAHALVWTSKPTTVGAAPIQQFCAGPTKKLPIADASTVSRVLELRARGLGYVAIDAEFGILGKKGWWSWKIVKECRA